jgi:hypothetical protein
MKVYCPCCGADVSQAAAAARRSMDKKSEMLRRSDMEYKIVATAEGLEETVYSTTHRGAKMVARRRLNKWADRAIIFQRIKMGGSIFKVLEEL